MENESPAHVATDDASHPTRPHKQGSWSNSQHQLFLEALQLYSKDWRKIASHIQTRTPSQVRSHAQKYFNKKEFDQQRIGANRQAIIGSQTDQIATRARVSRGPKKQPQREYHHAEDHAEDPEDGHPVSINRTKTIRKDKKEMKKSPKSKVKQSKGQQRIISPQVPIFSQAIYPFKQTDSQMSEQEYHYGYGYVRKDYVQKVAFNNQINPPEITDQEAERMSIEMLNQSNRRASSTPAQPRQKAFKRYVAQQSTEPSFPISAQPPRQQPQQNQDEQLPQSREVNKTKKIDKGRKGKRRNRRRIALETILEQQENSAMIVKEAEHILDNESIPYRADPRSYFTANVVNLLEKRKGKNGKIPQKGVFDLIQGNFKRYS